MNLIISIAALFFAVILHECAHGYLAWRMGDPTAKKAGRLTLNPLPHIDPIGTILIPAGLILLRLITGGGFFIFGWAKPVPIDPRYFKDPEKGMLFVGLAGPMTNLALFSIASLLGRLLLPLYINFFLGKGGSFFFELGSNAFLALLYFLGVFAIINTILATFNLIPIPPLDGSRILSYFLPARGKQIMAQMERYGFLIILALIWLGGLQGLFSLLNNLWAFALGNTWISLLSF